MSRASSHALRHPPATAPSDNPAGAPTPFPELAVAIEQERRRGRGAQSNASGRYEAEARIAFDDGWQSLEDLPPFRYNVVSKRMVRRLFGFDMLVAQAGSAAESDGITFFSQVNTKWQDRLGIPSGVTKGLVRIIL